MNRLLVAALLLAGCAWEGEGNVVEQRYVPERRYMVDGGSTCITYNDAGWCTFEIEHPDREKVDPEQFLLIVRDKDRDDHTVAVPEGVWLDCFIDARFVTTDGHCS